MNSKTQRILVVLVVLAISLLLSSQQNQITNLQTHIKNSDASAFKQQLQPGFACGLVTTKQARDFLQIDDIGTSGTIVPNDGPTASVRLGSPRVDSCSYTAFSNNLTYLDVIIKTYNGPADAYAGFKDTTKSVQDAKKGKFSNDTVTDVYASGVHYLLIGSQVFEIGASKKGAMLGAEQETFVDQIVTYVTGKL